MVAWHRWGRRRTRYALATAEHVAHSAELLEPGGGDDEDDVAEEHISEHIDAAEPEEQRRVDERGLPSAPGPRDRARKARRKADGARARASALERDVPIDAPRIRLVMNDASGTVEKIERF